MNQYYIDAVFVSMFVIYLKVVKMPLETEKINMDSLKYKTLQVSCLTMSLKNIRKKSHE